MENAQTSKKSFKVRTMGSFLLLGLLLSLLAACSSNNTSGAGPTTSTGTATETTAKPSTSTATKTITTVRSTTNATSNNVASAPQKQSEDTAPFLNIRMLDENNGWGLTAKAILKTSDGGKTWTDLTPSNVELTEGTRGTFKDAQTAWVATTKAATTTFLRTTDGGQSWQKSNIDDPNGVVSDQPHFINNQTGFLALGNTTTSGMQHGGADVFRTDDGGQSWTKILDATKGDQVGLSLVGAKTGITFVDENVGFMGSRNPAVDKIMLYRTVDGGKTWTVQSPEIKTAPGSAQAGIPVNATYTSLPPVMGENNGILPVLVSAEGDNSLVTFQTNDKGQTWTRKGFLSFDAKEVNALDLNHIWASNLKGVVYYSGDGGNLWNQVADTGKPLGKMSFINVNTGWAISTKDNKLLLHTTDGGKTWESIDYTFEK